MKSKFTIEQENYLNKLINEKALYTDISMLLDFRNESIKDSYREYDRRRIRYYIRICDIILDRYEDIKDVEEIKKSLISDYEEINLCCPIEEVSINNQINLLNEAFFKLESYGSGVIGRYKYFGFNDAFTVFFELAKDQFSLSVEDMIESYWSLAQQASIDIDKCRFKNKACYDNDEFIEDCEELIYVINDRAFDFIQFDSNNLFDEERYTVKDLLLDQRGSLTTKYFSPLDRVWKKDPKVTKEEFIEIGVENGLWDYNFIITAQKGSLYGTGKTLLASIYIALKGSSIKENLDYEYVGQYLCEAFNIKIDSSKKEQFKSFQSGDPTKVKECKRLFNLS